MSDWNWEWMTAGECADFWNDLMRQKTDQALNSSDPNSIVGFAVHWGAYTLNDAAELFIIDPLRLGRGCGEASTSGSWLQAGMGVVTDIGRATAFLPLGKLTKIIPKRMPGRLPVPSPAAVKTAGKATAFTAPTVSKAQSAVSAMYRNLFYFADPAGEKGICAFVSLTQALRHSGRIFTRIEQIAEMVGVKPCAAFFSELEGKAPTSMMEVFNWLKSLNVTSAPVAEVRGVEQLMQYAASHKAAGVYAFGLKWMMPGVKAGKAVLNEVGHLMYVGRTASGEVRIFDRSGHAVKSLYELEQLVPAYKGIHLANQFGQGSFAIFIENATLIEKTVKGFQAVGATFGAGISIGVPVRIFSFMTGKK